jgi:hypothetical protein
MIFEDASLLCCCTMWLCNLFPTFRRKVLPTSSGLYVNSRNHNNEAEDDNFLRNVGKQLPNHTAQQAEDLLFNTKKGLQLTKYFGACLFQWVMRKASRMTLSVSFAVVFFVSLACYTNDETSGCAMDRLPLRRDRDFKWLLPRNNVAFSFFLCLSVSHR